MELNSIAIVHATRGRPELAFQSALAIVANMRTDMQFTYIFSFDNDDPFLAAYEEKLPSLPFRYLTVKGDNRGAVAAMNAGAAASDVEDIVMIHADDSESPIGWDQSLRDIVAKIDDPIYYVHLSNLTNAKDCAIVPILSRGFYRKLGYVFYPEYVSMYADNELVMVARKLGICHEASIAFVHHHPAWNNSYTNGWDDTYRRSNATENYQHGCHLLNIRMANNFDNLVPPPAPARIDRLGGEPTGVYANTPLHLPDVTLVCADTTYYYSTMNALHWNLRQCKFGRAILFTDNNFETKHFSEEKIQEMGLRIVKIPTICGKIGARSYSYFMLKEVWKYVDTSYFLITQGDGYIIDPSAWEDEFFNYDYIGSVWHFYGDEHRVGNGGFSLRSTKLHTIVGNDTNVDGFASAEDFVLCRESRRYLEGNYGIKYASVEVANRFAYDSLPKPGRTFGFHSIETKGHHDNMIGQFGAFC